MKEKKTSRAELIRQHIKANPNASVAEIAKEFSTTYGTVYMIKKGMQPKKATVSASEVIAAQKAGISIDEVAKKKVKAKAKRGRKVKMVKDKVTGLTPKQNAELAYKFTNKVKGISDLIAEAEQTRKRLSIEMMEPKADPVNHPAHYKVGGIETIDYIKAKLTPEEYRGYLKGNLLKYSSRIGHKGAAQIDAGKAGWYANALVQAIEQASQTA